MSDDNNGLPANMDLEAILRTLASLPKPDGQPSQDLQNNHDQSHPFDSFHQPTLPIQHPPQHQASDPRLAGRPAPAHLQAPPHPQSRSSTPLIDPATIIEWKQGLRCVSKIAASNPDFSASVRKVTRATQARIGLVAYTFCS
jgi:hypothetical protein